MQRQYSRLQDPHGVAGRGAADAMGWKEFVRANSAAFGLPAASSPVYKFVLGSSVVRGADGSPREVDTLQHVLESLDPTSAPGISGLGFDMVKKMRPEVLRKLLPVFGGDGQWDYSRSGHAETHALLVSGRGLGLDKTGHGRAGDLRPLLIGDAFRRVFSKCVLLQEGEGIGEKLARKGQFGCGFRCGTETIYHLTARALEALHAEGIPCSSCETDAKNAYGSIHRAAIQRGIARWKPSLLPHFDFLYGPHVRARAYFFEDATPQPVGS